MNKTLLTVFKVILHVVGWPLLFVLVYVLNRDVIAGGSMYGLAVLVCLIVTAVMAIVYYLAYFLVRTKRKRSIRNQHVIIAIVAICCLCGFWALLDAFIPAPLETATSSTLRWEDLSDNWGARAEVQEQLLTDYVTINYNLGRLTAPNDETLEDYIKQGPNGNEELKALLEADFHSIDSDGYASFRGPSIDYAQADRMTIPVLLHLFLDDRSNVQGANSDYAKENDLDKLTIAVPYYNVYDVGVDPSGQAKYEDVRIYHGFKKNRVATFFVTDADLNDLYETNKVAVISRCAGKWTVMFKSCRGKTTTTADPKQFDKIEDAVAYVRSAEVGVTQYFVGSYREATVNWHVLDMMGTAMEMSLLDETVVQTDIVALLGGLNFDESIKGILVGTLEDNDVSTVASVLQMDLVPDALALVADMVAEREVLGSPLYISLDSETGTLSLNPSNAKRGVLGYMEMAWLNSQGLLYIIVSLFSTRTLFYAYAPFMALIAILLGLIREKERQFKASGASAAAKPPKGKKEKKGKKGAQAGGNARDMGVGADDLLDDEPLPKPVNEISEIDV